MNKKTASSRRASEDPVFEDPRSDDLMSEDSKSEDKVRLRMPPIIDHRPDGLGQRAQQAAANLWSAARDTLVKNRPFQNNRQDNRQDNHQDALPQRRGLRHFMRHLAYQSGLAALLIGALGLTVMALVQARAPNVSNWGVPDWGVPEWRLPEWRLPQFTKDGAPPVDLTEPVDPTAELGAQDAPPDAGSPIDRALTGEALHAADAASGQTPPAPIYKDTYNNSGDNRGENSGANNLDMAVTGTATSGVQTNVAPQDEELAARLQAEQAAHARTKAALAIARRANAKQDAAPNSPLMRRAVMAEWLVRLQNGLPYDDLLAPMAQGAANDLDTLPIAAAQPQDRLDAILTRRELSAFGLFAQTGVPTKAGLLAQLNRLSEMQNADGGGAVADADSAPDALTSNALTSNERKPDGWLGWLADNSNGLLAISAAAPLADAEQWAGLSRIITAGDYARAPIELRRILLQWELGESGALVGGDTGAAARAEISDALHALYADVQAMAELTPLMRDVRADFIAGVRP